VPESDAHPAFWDTAAFIQDPLISVI